VVSSFPACIVNLGNFVSGGSNPTIISGAQSHGLE
jgi:hypothetical protein